MVSCVPLALLLMVAGDGEARGGTPSALSTPQLRHHEVLRIDRDFGMAKWQLALDGWVPRSEPRSVDSLRLWWVNVEEGDRRKPLAPYLRRYLEFAFEPSGNGGLSVRLAGDRKEYAFMVALDASGVPVVHATIERDDGTRIERCRCERARLLARRVLGLPVGIANLRVHCTDDSGGDHDGNVVFRGLEDGPLYQPEP